MILDWIILAILGAAAWQDLKKHVISDKLSGSLIFLGIINIIFLAFFSQAGHIHNGLLELALGFGSALVACLIVGFVAVYLFNSGAWAGGDVKLLIALGFVYGLHMKLLWFVIVLFANTIASGKLILWLSKHPRMEHLRLAIARAGNKLPMGQVFFISMLEIVFLWRFIY